MRIKQLEWEEDSYGDFEASGFWGIFQVVHSESGEGFTASLNDYNNYEGYEEEDFPTAEEGKAYCQTLLEKQVQAALGFVDWAKKKTPKEWANIFGCLFAVNRDGRGFSYNGVPECETAKCFGEWYCRSEWLGACVPKSLIDFNGDWKTSLAYPDNWEATNGKDRADD